jgi:hypothetical protein
MSGHQPILASGAQPSGLAPAHILRCVSEAQFIAGRFGTTRYRFPLAVPVNPTGLPEGSRWSAGAKGGRPPERRANGRAPRRGARRYRAYWLAGLLAYAESRLLASLRDANGSSPVNRWSFPPATLERPTGYPLPTLPGWAGAPAGRTPSSIRSVKGKPSELWVMTRPLVCRNVRHARALESSADYGECGSSCSLKAALRPAGNEVLA